MARERSPSRPPSDPEMGTWAILTSTGALTPELSHRERMQRKKTVVDAAVARATESRGLLLVLAGNGKGKSSSALGMLARALGHGFRVAVAQFVKGRSDMGEAAFFRCQPAVTWRVLGEGFSWETQDRERDATTTARA